MRKLKRISLVIVLFMCIFITTGCKDRKALTQLGFKELMTGKGYEVTEFSSGVSGSIFYNNVINASLAEKDTILVIYGEFENEGLARNEYDRLISDYEKGSTTGLTEKLSITNGNYQRYSVITNDTYVIVARISNTIILSEVDLKDRAEVSKTFDDIGY